MLLIVSRLKVLFFKQVADFSLSSFLGQLESPVKSSQRSQAEVPMIEIIRPPSDVRILR